MLRTPNQARLPPSRRDMPRHRQMVLRFRLFSAFSEPPVMKKMAGAVYAERIAGAWCFAPEEAFASEVTPPYRL